MRYTRDEWYEWSVCQSCRPGLSRRAPDVRTSDADPHCGPYYELHCEPSSGGLTGRTLEGRHPIAGYPLQTNLTDPTVGPTVVLNPCSERECTSAAVQPPNPPNISPPGWPYLWLDKG